MLPHVNAEEGDKAWWRERGGGEDIEMVVNSHFTACGKNGRGSGLNQVCGSIKCVRPEGTGGALQRVLVGARLDLEAVVGLVVALGVRSRSQAVG